MSAAREPGHAGEPDSCRVHGGWWSDCQHLHPAGSVTAEPDAWICVCGRVDPVLYVRADAAASAQAEAWDKGYAQGWADGADSQQRTEPIETPNPYRSLPTF